MTPRCIVFDFDGVLVDSNAVKRQAYFTAFSAAGVPDRIVTSCLESCVEGDRYDVIACILQRAGAAAAAGPYRDVAWYAAEYGRLCDDGVGRAPEIRGASGVLPQLAARFPLYLNSATPEDALIRLIANRGWSPWFRQVLGRPRTKLENLTRIAAAEAIAPGEMIFVGDRRGDQDAARAFGCAFIGRRSDESDFDPVPPALIDDLDGLPALLGVASGSVRVP